MKHNDKKIILFLILIVVISASYIFYQVNFIRINHIKLESKKIPQGENLKILQISDVHNKSLDGNIGFYNRIEKLDLDMIVITGDLIDAKTRDFTNVYEIIEKLKDINEKIYYVSGNHEWRSNRKSELVRGLVKRGVNILDNDNTTLNIGGIDINICGIDDPETGHDNSSLAFNEIDEELYTILLSHGPRLILNGESIPADLILCGHTHGGQIRLPIVGSVIAPGQGLFPKYDKGVFNLGNSRVLYIDSGLGISVFPVRFLNRSQISYITINPLTS